MHSTSCAAIVVCGCRVREDGQASRSLVRRVEHAVAQFHGGAAPRLLLSGARGEALAGAELARNAGVPDHAIVLETEALDTHGNARLSAEILGSVPVLVVSDTYHLPRCRILFQRYFPTVATSGPGLVVARDWQMVLREAGAFGRLVVTPGR